MRGIEGVLGEVHLRGSTYAGTVYLRFERGDADPLVVSGMSTTAGVFQVAMDHSQWILQASRTMNGYREVELFFDGYFSCYTLTGQ